MLFRSFSAAAHGSHTHWGYTGHDSPESWGNLSEEFRLCSTGKNQSPVNITETVSGRLPAIKVNYKPSAVDMKVRVLCTGNKKSILGQYILFTQIYSRQKKECNDIETAVKNTIEICMSDEILKEYLDYRKMEVQEMITAFTTQEEAFESFLKDEVKAGEKRGRKEGEEKGREEGKMDTLINFFKNGIGLDVISKGLGMSIDEVRSILIGRGFEV